MWSIRPTPCFPARVFKSSISSMPSLYLLTVQGDGFAVLEGDLDLFRLDPEPRRGSTVH